LKVLYVTSNGGIHDYRFLKKLTDDYEVFLLHYASGKLIDEIKKIKGLTIISKRPFLKSFPLLSEYFHFKKVYNSFKPDIVHTGYVWQVGILAALLNVHPHLSMPWGSDILFQPQKNFLIKRIVKKVMNQCDHIQCDAEFVKNKIIEDYGIEDKKFTVFARGIDLDAFSPRDKLLCRKKIGIGENLFIVIFNRHLAPVYGITDLLEGFNMFSKNKNDVLLLLVTDGILKNKVANYIKNNNLKTKISLVGRVSNQELPIYLNAADVYITTSLSDGTSLSFLEAMATGHGIIATNVPSILELASGNNALIVQRKNPKSVSEALNVYYNNKHLIEKHGAINKQIAADKADWNKNYLKLKEIYNQMIEQNKKNSIG
jgi:glycosyltransferase involved in cell wall biosynthesis